MSDRGVVRKIGLSVTSIGLILFLIALIPVTRVDEVINTSFTLTPGTIYGPYDKGTYYHTGIWFVKSALQGNILVDGEGVFISVNGYNAGDFRNIYVKGEKAFTIEPADDQYTFTFDNTQGSASSLVKFTLREVWTASYSPLVWILGLVGLCLMIPGGLTIFVATYFRSGKAAPQTIETYDCGRTYRDGHKLDIQSCWSSFSWIRGRARVFDESTK